MRNVNHHTYLVHFLHHLATESSQALAGICGVRRRITDIIVVRVGESHVLDTHILVLLHVLDVLTDAITVFNTKEECFLSFSLQAESIFFGQGDTTIVLVLSHIRISVFNHLDALFYGLL